MAKQRPTSKHERMAKEPARLPATFRPRFLEEADQRQACIKAIRQRMKRLKEDAGCDSFQKEMLVEEAVFISVQLATMKVDALEGKHYEPGVYTQMVNCLSGLLTKLGLERQAVTLPDLRSYVGGKA